MGWLGAGAANLVIAAAVVRGHGDVSVLAGFALINLIDYAIVIPCAVGALITGTLLSVCTKWGLTQYWWVLTKFVLTVVVIVTSTPRIGLWVETGLERLHVGEGNDSGPSMLVVCSANIVAFLVMTWLSVLEPWGRTPWAAAVSSRRRRSPTA